MNARSDGQPQIRFRQYPYGVSYRPQHNRRKPWIVKFRRHKRMIYAGVYETLEQATLAAQEFVRKERNVTT